MTALIIAYYVISSIFYAGVALINPNGTIQSVTLSPAITLASSSPADVQAGFVNAAIATASAQGFTITASDVLSELSVLPLNRTFNYPTRSLNTAFQVSTTQDSQVSYGVNISATLSLTTGQTGTVVLEYADDSGFTTNVKTVQSSVNGNSGTLALGLGLGQSVTATVTGMVPAGKYVRVRTVNTTGTPSFTLTTAQEVLI